MFTILSLQFSRVRVILLFFIALCICESGISQEKSSTNYSVRGNIQASSQINFYSGMSRRQDPFNYRIDGSLWVEAYGVKTGININYADQRTIYNLNLPEVKIPNYALLGISPSYKWITGHIGFRNMKFSDYSLAGHSFNGLGLELKPGSWRFSSMYGRLRRAQVIDMGARQNLDASYQRNAYGISLGYQNSGNELYLNVFSARDGNRSGLSLVEDGLFRKENIVASITGKKNLGSILRLEWEYALSAINRDVDADRIDDNSFNNLYGLINRRTSFEANKALKTSAWFDFKKGNFFLKHERIDPGYESLGALFINNDLDRISMGGSLKPTDRLSISAEVGVQNNNISDLERNTLRRIVGRLYGNYAISDKQKLSFTWSNLQSTQKIRSYTLPIIDLDSITLSLVNQSINLQYQYLHSSGKSLSIVGSRSTSSAIENDAIIADQENSNFQGQVMYNHPVNPSFSFQSSVSYYAFQNNIQDIQTISPSLSASYTIKQKLRSKIGLSYINFRDEEQLLRSMVRPHLSCQYTLPNGHVLSMNSSYIYNARFLQGRESEVFGEWNTQIRYKVSLR